MLKEINACVIVPTYNNENTLSNVLTRILDVIENETLIVINDGSTDNTEKILSNFKSKIITIS